MRHLFFSLVLSLSLNVNGQDWAKVYDHHYPADFEGGPHLVEKGGKWGFVKENGDALIPLEYDDVITYIDRWNGAHEMHRGFTPSGFAVLKKNGKEGMINTKGEIIIPFEYDEIGTHDDYWLIDNDLIAVKKGKKWGLYNTKGDMIMKPTYGCLGAEHDCTPYFKDGLMTAISNFHKCKAVINTKGETIINQGDYDFLKLLEGGFIEVTLEDYKGVVNSKGELIIAMNFTEVLVNKNKEGKVVSFTCYDSELRHYMDFNLEGVKIKD